MGTFLAKENQITIKEFKALLPSGEVVKVLLELDEGDISIGEKKLNKYIEDEIENNPTFYWEILEEEE